MIALRPKEARSLSCRHVCVGCKILRHMAIITSVLDKFTIIIAFQYCRKYAINGYYNFYCVFHHCRPPLPANPISILSTHVFDLLWITMMGILQRPYVRCVCFDTNLCRRRHSLANGDNDDDESDHGDYSRR